MRPLRKLTAFLTFATLLSTSPAAADDADTCVNGSGDEKIAACTRAINSGSWIGPDLVWAYVNRGNAYHDKVDNDRALQDYDQAISLNPNLAAPYQGRGNVDRAKGDNDGAVADYSRAIALDPNYALAYHGRGNAYHSKGDNDRAMADQNEAIRLDPNYAYAYFSRGRLYFYGKSVALAEADFRKGNQLNPKYAYGALWLGLAERRNDVPNHLAQAATQLDMTAWPAPVVRLLLGEMTPNAALDAAQNADARTMKGQVCEANFFSGELALLQGKRDEAIRLFRLAAGDCPPNFVESVGAHAELRELGAAR
jgi:lipoprotein NlpI